MLSKNRLLLNQSYCTRDGKGNIHQNTRHTYESVHAIFDINIVEGTEYWVKNGDQFIEIPASEQKYFDFIKANLSQSNSKERG